MYLHTYRDSVWISFIHLSGLPFVPEIIFIIHDHPPNQRHLCSINSHFHPCVPCENLRVPCSKKSVLQFEISVTISVICVLIDLNRYDVAFFILVSNF
jgi:hypothetical protein